MDGSPAHRRSPADRRSAWDGAPARVPGRCTPRVVGAALALFLTLAAAWGTSACIGKTGGNDTSPVPGEQSPARLDVPPDER